MRQNGNGADANGLEGLKRDMQVVLAKTVVTGRYSDRYLGMRDRFLANGGTAKEIRMWETCLRDVTGLLRGRIPKCLGNGGFFYRAPWCIDLQIKMMMMDFTYDDFKLMSDIIADEIIFPDKRIFV